MSAGWISCWTRAVEILTPLTKRSKSYGCTRKTPRGGGRQRGGGSSSSCRAPAGRRPSRGAFPSSPGSCSSCIRASWTWRRRARSPSRPCPSSGILPRRVLARSLPFFFLAGARTAAPGCGLCGPEYPAAAPADRDRPALPVEAPCRNAAASVLFCAPRAPAVPAAGPAPGRARRDALPVRLRDRDRAQRRRTGPGIPAAAARPSRAGHRAPAGRRWPAP